MSYDDIKTTGQRMLNKYQLKKDFQWKEVDSLKKSYKKCLRPLFMKIDFSSEITDNPWLKSIEWLQSVFAKSQKLSDRPFSECPDKTIPKYLQDYLLENAFSNIKCNTLMIL